MSFLRREGRRVVGLRGLLVLLLPMAPAAAQDGQGIGIGTVHLLESKVLGETRPVFVHAPPQCAADGAGRCPVLYTTDGAEQFAHTVTTASFLARQGRVPPLVIVGIPNTADRSRDLTPHPGGNEFDGELSPVRNSGGGRRFLDFIERELIPWVEARHRTHPYRILAGHSFGGLLALHAFAVRPELFQAVIAVSPTLRYNDGEPIRELRALLDGRKELKRSLFLSLGSEGAELQRSWDSLRRMLKGRGPEGFRWEMQQFEDEDHGSVVLRSHYHGLRHVFDGWAMPRDPVTGALPGRLEDLVRHYAGLSERLGYEVQPPEALVNRLGYALLARKDVDGAIRVLEHNTRAYPGSPNVWDSLAEAQAADGQLDEARANHARAVELARAKGDANLPAFERNLKAIEERLDARR